MSDPTSSAGPVVCFGEILLRLSAPDGEILLQSPELAVHVGGAEANVAVGLARLGDAARMVSVVPDNPLGQAAVAELRRWGVDVSGVVTGAGRMGLYFLAHGAGLRASEVTYDRAGSVFALADPARIDWDTELAGARWLVLSGVTPAVGANGAAATQRAGAAANRIGVPVAFDGNYRGKLWALWDGDGAAVLRDLVAGADLALVNDQDLELILKRRFEAADPAERLAEAAAAAFETFPRLQRIAATTRLRHEVGRQELSGMLIARGSAPLASRRYALTGIIDRIGAGDAFAAGLLHGLLAGDSDQRALDLGMAAAVAKHSIRGDFNLATAEAIAAILAGETLDVRR
jgi:2-dehydro-3-deoxygluconokinase